tara:strand:- start:1125 stop:1685 length:561 start_codon:yes stop_codon:yes gene_type:complete
MVSQFKSNDAVNLLGGISFLFPEGIHAIGRLDNDSEGLLLLTTDKRVTRLLFSGPEAHVRSYLVQVKGIVTDETIELLRNGIDILIAGPQIFKTTPCEVVRVIDPATIYPQIVLSKEYKPTSWLLISNTEGKFRQVRKMVKAANHPCKRLIRVAIENVNLGELLPGEVQELSAEAFFEKLKININT